jgi:hypothetical protein
MAGAGQCRNKVDVPRILVLLNGIRSTPMRELTGSELGLISGGTDGPLYLDATGLNAHLVFAPVTEPTVIGLLGLIGITPNTGDSELRLHLGGPVTPAPINFV